MAVFEISSFVEDAVLRSKDLALSYLFLKVFNRAHVYYLALISLLLTIIIKLKLSSGTLFMIIFHVTKLFKKEGIKRLLSHLLLQHQ